MTTKLAGDKALTRELAVVVQDAGARELVITLRGDGVIFLRAKGLQRQVMWSLPALYDKGVKEGRSI
jgi:hypothetical protein